MKAAGDTVGAAPATRTVPAWSLAVPVVVVVLAAAVASGVILLDSSPKTPWVAGGGAAVGKKAPDFGSWDLRGDPVTLSRLAGRPILLSFWATWCTACEDELPAIQRLQDQYGSSGFTVLAVDYRQTNTAQMEQFLGRLKVSFEAVIDPNGAIASAYGVDIGLPVNVWIDRTQTVRDVMLGAQPASQLAAAAAQLAG